MKMIHILKNNETFQEIKLSSEELSFGREKESVDVHIEGQDISRKHFKIIQKYGNIYVENLSTSSPLFINDQQVEHGALKEGDTLRVGEYTLSIEEKAFESQENAIQENSPLGEEIHLDDEALSEESHELNDQESKQSFHSQISDSDEEEILEDFEELNQEMNENAFNNLDLSSDSPVAFNESFDNSDLSSEKTFVSEEEEIIGVLKIIAGEDKLGRELKLKNQESWTVGRSPDCDIVIQNDRLSREHFQISKKEDSFFVKDLGSSNGTLLNGVKVTEAKIDVFDRIIASAVELQFFITSSSHENVALDREKQKEFFPPEAFPEFEFENGDFENIEIEETFFGDKEDKKVKAAQGKSLLSAFNKIPKKKKIIYGSLLAGALALLLIPQEEKVKTNDVPAPTESQAQKAQEKSAPEIDLSSNDYSSDYHLKSPEEKEKIAQLYQEASRARAKENWDVAFNKSQELLGMIEKYKDITDIQNEAMIYLNNEIVPTLTKDKTDLDVAKMNIKEKVVNYNKKGDESVREGRWDDAKEYYTKALTLDPLNEEAAKGNLAAFKKDPSLLDEDLPDLELAEESEEEVITAPDPIELEKEKAKNEIATLEDSFEKHKDRLQEGLFREVKSDFERLKIQVYQKLNALKSTSKDRFPASFSESLNSRTFSLASKVDEAIEVINDQYIMEYKTDLDDAKTAVENKEYEEAKNIYDQILKKDPDFKLAKEERAKLFGIFVDQAVGVYQEALIYESIGDLEKAVENYKKVSSMLVGVDSYEANEYKNKTLRKIEELDFP